MSLWAFCGGIVVGLGLGSLACAVLVREATESRAAAIAAERRAARAAHDLRQARALTLRSEETLWRDISEVADTIVAIRSLRETDPQR